MGSDAVELPARRLAGHATPLLGQPPLDGQRPNARQFTVRMMVNEVIKSDALLITCAVTEARPSGMLAGHNRFIANNLDQEVDAFA